MATRKDLFGCPGESRSLARRIKLKMYTFSFPLFYLRLRCGCQNANTTLSLQLPMKFGNIIRVETSRYLTKITTLQRKADREQLQFLRLSIGLRYNYYVQLVATKRDWMCVPNLKIWSPRQRGGGSCSTVNTTALCFLGEGSKISNSLRASDLAWLPPTAHGNCSEAARTFAISLPPQCRDLY